MKSHVTTCDIVQDKIIVLHDTYGFTFREISQIAEFRPIPPGTICSIYKTGNVPNKWRKMLGIPELKLAPACPTCGGVHVSRRCPDKRKPPTRWADMPVKQVLKALRERQEL